MEPWGAGFVILSEPKRSDGVSKDPFAVQNARAV
jgi:hypothetical protein